MCKAYVLHVRFTEIKQKKTKQSNNNKANIQTSSNEVL